MASSVFIWPGLFTSNGTTINPSLPIAFTNGLVGAPSITFVNELTSGWYRAGAGDIRCSLLGADALQVTGSTVSVLLASGLQVPSGASLGAGSSWFLTSTGVSGQMKLQNDAANSGVGFDLTTDAILKVRTRAFSAYATIDCLGLKSSGTACASFGPSAVASITVVNGLITAIS